MPTAGPSRRLTYDDFLLFPDDGQRHEIIDGVHYVTPSPVIRHQVLVGRLYFAIEAHLRAHPGAGQVFLSPLDVVLSHWDVVEPDLLVIGGDQQAILTEKNVQGPPALVIEVLSPGTRRRDEGVKRDLFDRTAVREYWLVDPEAKTVVPYRRAEGGALKKAPVLSADAGSVLTTPVLPGFVLTLEALFA
jgi:Uma2 family endonuclease